MVLFLIFYVFFLRCHHCQELSPELDAAADQMALKNQFVFGKVSTGHLTKVLLCHHYQLICMAAVSMTITNALNVSSSLREFLFCRLRSNRPFSR